MDKGREGLPHMIIRKPELCNFLRMQSQ